MSAYAHTHRPIFSTRLDPIKDWFKHSKVYYSSKIAVPREATQLSPLSQVQLISHKVISHTQTFTQWAAQLRAQTHHEVHESVLSLEKTVDALTIFCQTVAQELEPMSALAQPDVSSVRTLAPNELSQEAVRELIEGLLHNQRSVKGFMTAFLTASYQRPNGYQLCLSVVGGRGNDFIGKVGVQMLRHLGLIGFKTLPEFMLATAIAAVVNCCWSLERAAAIPMESAA